MPSFRSATATIANGASLSGAVEVNYVVGSSQNAVRETLVGIIMPSSWTAADLTFQASNDNSTFTDMFSSAGTEITVIVAASRWIPLDPADFAGVAYLKLRSGNSGVPVNQGAARSITLIFRPAA